MLSEWRPKILNKKLLGNRSSKKTKKANAANAVNAANAANAAKKTFELLARADQTLEKNYKLFVMLVSF